MKHSNGWSFVVLFMVTLLTIGGYMYNQANQYDTEDMKQYEIKSGDTLWDIAHQYKTEHKLTHAEFTQWVENVNQVHSTQLQPGDVIIIPVKHIESQPTYVAHSS